MIHQYKPSYTEVEAKALYDLVMSGSFLADFKKTKEFETHIAVATGNKHCIAVNNGTIAISLALLASGVTSDDVVVVPNITMIATATAVDMIGARPVFCDIESDTLCMDVEKAIDLIKEHRAKAIIYVTLNGRINETAVLRLATYCLKHHITLIKDDAQSLGSRSDNNYSLQSEMFGDIHTLSFSPHKIISCGQGGAIVTNNDFVAEKMRRVKDFGRLQGGADIHDHFGINSKFTEMQAVVGLCQLEKLYDRIEFKKSLYNEYYKYLKDFMIAPKVNESPWFVDIYLSCKSLRSELIAYLTDRGIGTRPIYPKLTSQLIYSDPLNRVLYPNSTYFGETGLWLPSSFSVTNEEVKYICETIKEFLKNG